MGGGHPAPLFICAQTYAGRQDVEEGEALDPPRFSRA